MIKRFNSQALFLAWPWGVGIAALVMILDQGIKHRMLTWLDWGGVSPAIPGLFQWHVVKNTGAAWSLFHQQQDLLRLGTGLLLTGLAFMAVRQKHVALWLVLGAAVSNWWDRWHYQGVVDYIDLTFMRYPIFNLADAIIVLSALWLAWTYWKQNNAPIYK